MSNGGAPGVLRARLRRRLEAGEPRKTSFYARSAERRAALLAESVRARDLLLEPLLARAAATSGALGRAAAELVAYARRCDWVLIDPAALGGATAEPVARVAERLAPRLLVYHAFRMVDDVLDDHRDYKGTLPTALGTLLDDRELAAGAAGANLLAAFLLFGRGVVDLTGDERALTDAVLSGALAELFPGAAPSLADYRAIVDGKMVRYGLLLYGPVLAGVAEPRRDAARDFLARSFYAAQVLNDLGDQDEDRRAGRPNLWLIDPAGGAGEELERVLVELEHLADTCDADGDDLVAGYMWARLADLARYGLGIADRLGLT